MPRQKICTAAGHSNVLLRSFLRKRHLMAATVLGAFVLGDAASVHAGTVPSGMAGSNGAATPSGTGKKLEAVRGTRPRTLRSQQTVWPVILKVLISVGADAMRLAAG